MERYLEAAEQLRILKSSSMLCILMIKLLLYYSHVCFSRHKLRATQRQCDATGCWKFKLYSRVLFVRFKRFPFVSCRLCMRRLPFHSSRSNFVIPFVALSDAIIVLSLRPLRAPACDASAPFSVIMIYSLHYGTCRTPPGEWSL